MLPVSAGCWLIGESCDEEVCSLLLMPSVGSQTSLSGGAPCAVLRSATAVEAEGATGELPSASAPPVFTSAAKGCPAQLSPAVVALLLVPGASLALSVTVCAWDSPGVEPGWAASARLSDLVPVSVPPAALAAWAGWLLGLSRAAGALGPGPAFSAAATPARIFPAPLASVDSTSIMEVRTSLV